MYFELAKEESKELKKRITLSVHCLTKLLSMETWTESEDLKQVIDNLPEDESALETGIHRFALICRRDPSSTQKIVDELAAALQSVVVLSSLSVGNQKFKRFPGMVPHYFQEANSAFNSLLSQLGKETRMEPRKIKGDGNIIIDSPAGFSVKLTKDELASERMISTLFSQAAEGSSSERHSAPFREPAAARAEKGEQPPVSAKPEFRLPDPLEQLKLKPEDREFFVRVLTFFEEEHLPYRSRIYVLLILNLDKLLFRYLRKKEELDICLDKICGGNSKTGRRARDFRCLYRYSDSRVPTDFELKGTDPEFEQEVLALLKK